MVGVWQEQVPLAVFRDAPGEHDECFLLWAGLLQELWRGESLSAPELEDADRLSRPDALKIATPLVVNPFRSIGPTLEAIRAEDEAGFNGGVIAALEAHKKRSSRGKEAEALSNLLCPIAAGLAALGMARGLRLSVQSGYMPDWMFARGVRR